MSTESQHTLPRLLGCLVKGPAGCLAFLVGAAAVVVLLLPPVLGRVIDREGEGWFEERYAGELELGDAWVGSLHGPQEIERVILRDPDGEEVLRGTLTGPSMARTTLALVLPGLFDGPPHRYGPVRLQLELLRVIADEDGVTNLERAFEPQSFAPDESARGSGLSTDTPFELELELHVVRLRYTSERGREALFEDLRFHGRLEWGPSQTHLVLEGGTDEATAAGARCRLRLEYERAEDGLGRPWDVALALEGVPTVLARALCPALRPLAAHLGAGLDELEWTRKGSAVTFAGRDAGTHLAFQGMEVDGSVSGAPEAALELALACDESLGRALLARFLPPLERLECEDPLTPHVVRLHAFHWPLDGDWSRLEGEAELGLAPARAVLLPFAADAAPLVALLGPQPARLSVREGLLDFAGFQLPLEDGWIRLDGELELASGERTLGVSGESAGQPLARVQLGEDADPSSPRPPVPPEFPPPEEFDVPAVPEPEH